MLKISFKYSSNFIFHRILKRKCTAALKPFLLTWNGSCTTASSTTEVNLFDVPSAASSLASSQPGADLPTKFQVTTNWLQLQRSSSRFANMRYSTLLKNGDCVAVARATVFLSSVFDFMPQYIRFADEWDWGVSRVLLVCVPKKRQLVLRALRRSSRRIETYLYVTHLAYSKASELFSLVANRVNLTRLCGPNWRASRFGLQKLYVKRMGRWMHAFLDNMTGEAILVQFQKY